MYARITRFRKRNENSPGWRTPYQFKIIAANKFLQIGDDLLPGVGDDKIIEEYALSWNAASKKFSEKNHLIYQRYVFNSGEPQFFVLLFETLDQWQERTNFINATTELTRFNAARDALAELLQVDVSVYEPIEVQLNTLTTEYLIALTNSLD